ncbi:unnamed protein product [Chondrus crispus]|uniref:Kazal-like domain-containing protein n=1 Tax=Chondrus crispus TaxID=2769 RepID=R7QBQ6_CHOCR|nr:unnamed protein product [Chondrus crispus]CDF35223.1 unnamed protein product [Chondrus crispus]|eukprot:XP_005715042.1 unnamed protein product [Chondrus crispus]
MKTYSHHSAIVFFVCFVAVLSKVAAMPHCKDAASCCEQFGIQCPKPGDTCSTGGGFLPPPLLPCGLDLTCVIKDFGNPSVDNPNKGVCKEVDGVPPTCSRGFCSSKGARAICSVPDGISKIAFCGSWATRTDGFPGPDCGFVCPQLCLPDGPFGSDGMQYCSSCILASASCASNFRIYGPVPMPH